jgi:isopentenyl diphosphate isomerase/L-lactate dehydrogenase-like FMN-dependent dehydrogenase
MATTARLTKLARKYPSIADLEARAQRRLPLFVWDYMAGGAGDESGLSHNRSVYKSIKFTPNYLEPRRPIDFSTEILGGRFDQPFGVDPVGLTGLIWPKAPEYLARAAVAANIPYSLANFSTTDIETIGNIAGANAWLQLSTIRDDDVQFDLLDRAKAAGFSAIIATIDTASHRRSLRDLRNGFTMPPKLTPRNLLSIAQCPSWALTTLANGIPRFKTMLPYTGDMAGTVGTARMLEALLQLGIDWTYVEKLRARWDGPMVIKGVLSPSDAEHCRRSGVDAIIVSTHGARVSEALIHPLDALPAIRDAVGSEVKLIVDSGVRSGLDIARALARGADFVLMGRAFMFAVAALGEIGADLAVDLLRTELEQVLQQIGCFDIADLPKHLA